MPLYYEDFAKIIIACFLGGLIGAQRQRKGMSIGLRTHIVVCVSATLVQIISIDYNILNKTNFEIMRLGAQVISGIGFLGMASIIKEGRTIVGLTTAASMWFIACVGLAVGSGLYIPATMATFVICFILKDVFNLDKKIRSKRFTDNICELEVTLNWVNDKNGINIILNTISQKDYKILNTNINAEDKSNVIIHITMSLPPNKVSNEIFTDLLQLEYVKKVNMF
ncbi:MAG: MgtC/SapB family protein [Desulfosporosinus sp.]|nr:MgtC/SapB family protein [Desulfosporosinus sp.]